MINFFDFKLFLVTFLIFNSLSPIDKLILDLSLSTINVLLLIGIL